MKTFLEIVGAVVVGFAALCIIAMLITKPETFDDSKLHGHE